MTLWVVSVIGHDWLTRRLSLQFIAAAIMAVCSLAILTAVAASFLVYGPRRDVKERRRGFVATATMVAFFVGFVALIGSGVGQGFLPWLGPGWDVGLPLVGLALVVAGCLLNLAGRVALGENWADQVTLYGDQRLVTRGAYRIVRHPLYASLVWMFLGAALVYADMAALAANALIFVPMMVIRARREERLLEQAFPDYAAYRARVGMLFPRLWPGGGGAGGRDFGDATRGDKP